MGFQPVEKYSTIRGIVVFLTAIVLTVYCHHKTIQADHYVTRSTRKQRLLRCILKAITDQIAKKRCVTQYETILPLP